MAFKDFCSCYMFATTGFNQADAGTVQASFQAYADVNKALLPRLNALGLNDKVQHLVEYMRLFGGSEEAAGADKAITVFGVYDNKNSATPTHMWIKFGKDLYDTMPNAPLRKRANAAKDNQPPSVDGDEPANLIGKFACKLTTWQVANLAAKDLYKE